MLKTVMTQVATHADAELVRASLAGDRDAFGQIVARYQSLVCSLAYSATGSLSQSEDLAQETFLTAWKQLAGLREPAKLRAWLCGINRNLTHDSLRKQGREPSHHAELLEGINESHSPEPQPVERAISQEEAGILWRSLERIPETYREPMILFYREHQSIAVVAQDLDLTEEAVRQRLSRGRRLLQEEMLAFVQGALEKTAPGMAFTVAVVAALPIAVTTAKAATAGVALAKAGTGTKGILSLGTWASFLTLPAAILFSWKTVVDDAKSPRERKFLRRMACGQIALFVILLSAASLIGWIHHPWAIGAVLAALFLAIIANAAIALPYLHKRQTEIRLEDGTFLQDLWPGSEANAQPKALRRTIRVMLPMLIMFVGGAIGLPWKHHWLRCTVVMAAESLVLLWGFRRFQQIHNHQFQLSSSRKLTFIKNPLLKAAFVLVLGGGVLGCLLPYFLNPEMANGGIPFPAWLGPLGLYLLVALLTAAAVIGLLYLSRRKLATPWEWLAGKFNLPSLRSVQAMTQGPGAVTEKLYGPLCQQLNLDPGQQVRLKDLILKRTMVGVEVGKSLMNPTLAAAKRTAVAREMKTETDACNAQIKECLGDDHHAAFQQFEKTIPDRMLLHMVFTRPAATAADLSPEQQAQLLQALTEARSQYPWTTEMSRRNQNVDDYCSLLTKENLDIFAREEEQFARQFLAQAQPLLRPAQLAKFEQDQARHRQSQLSQYKTARKLFGQKSG